MVNIIDNSSDFIKTICPGCKKDIKAIKIENNLRVRMKEGPFKTTIRLLGCPKCKIVFFIQ